MFKLFLTVGQSRIRRLGYVEGVSSSYAREVHPLREATPSPKQEGRSVRSVPTFRPGGISLSLWIGCYLFNHFLRCIPSKTSLLILIFANLLWSRWAIKTYLLMWEIKYASMLQEERWSHLLLPVSYSAAAVRQLTDKMYRYLWL